MQYHVQRARATRSPYDDKIYSKHHYLQHIYISSCVFPLIDHIIQPALDYKSVNLNTDHPKIKSFSGSLYILICVNRQNSSFFKATAIWVVQLSACCKAFDSFEDFGKLNNLFNMHCCHTVLKQVGC